MDVFDLQAKISLDDSAFTNGLSAAAGKAKTFAKVGIGVATAATAVMVGGFAKAAKSSAEYGDNVDKMSQKIGISAESYQKWDYVMQRAGTSVDNLKMGMKTLSKQAESNSESFQKLGISQEEVASLSQEELFNKTIQGLADMEAGTERTALASELLGRAGADLGPLLNQGSAAIQEQMEIAERYGMVMPDAAVKASAAFQDSMTTMQMTFTGLKNRLMGEFLPSITQVTDGLAMMFAGDYDEGMAKIDEGINAFVQNINNILPKVLEIGGQILGSLANAIIQNLPTLIESGGKLMKSFAQGIIQNLPQIIQTGLSIIKTIVMGIGQALPDLINGAGEVIAELANGISQSLPELIPAAVDIILSIVEALIDNIDIVIDAAIQIITALAEGIINALPVLIEKAPTIISKLVTAIVNNAPKLLSAGVQIIARLVAGIGSAIGQLTSMAGQAISNFLSGIGSGLSSILSKGKELVQRFIDGIKSAFSGLLSAGKSAVDSVKNGITGKIKEALSWGKDLMSNLIGGIRSKIGELTNVVSNVGSKIKSFLGFSEPEEGPLSDFHTYAPDMMNLFIKGIRDNRKKLLDETRKAFDLKDVVQGGFAIGINGNASQSRLRTNGDIIINLNYSADNDANRLLTDIARGVSRYRMAGVI